MRRWTADRWRGAAFAVDGSLLVAVAALAAMVVACYGGVLFGGQQFAFRDSAHFYYPLYWRVQQEWSAGRLPMWEPGANGGTPMLGTPMAAVLYPGKLVFALVPYAWGVRLYTVGHEVLAFWAMMALMRSWGVSRAGATMAGLSYAFGGPVLSDYFNIIYLVGASWVPLGFRAADRWLRLGRRSGVVELALVLAMQVLGGDPEAAYLTALCAFGYGVAPGAFGGRRTAPAVGVAVGAGRGGGSLDVGGALAGWSGPRGRRIAEPGAVPVGVGRGPRGLCGDPAARAAIAAGGDARRAWAPPGPWPCCCRRCRCCPCWTISPPASAGRAAGPEDLYDSSLLPYRAFEWIWPNVSGTFTAGNRYWITILPPTGAHRPSPLSLYAGALPIVLAMGAAGFRGGPPWRAWMTTVALLSFWASLGAFAGPASWSAARPSPEVGDDSFYGLLTIVLPALRLFRFPFKLLPFTALGLSALAGLGWDRVSSGVGRRRTLTVAVVLLLLTVLGLAAAAGMRGALADAIARRASSHLVFGPIDPAGAAGAIVQGLAHGAVALASGVAVLAWSAGRRGAIAAAMAMAVIVVDLAVANAPLVVAIPQADFEREPEALRAIREAERNDPSPGPFRIHRMPSWVPVGWADSRSTRRLRELVDWEIDTLQPSFGWLHGLRYVFVDESEIARDDTRRLFRPASRALDAGLAAALEIEPDRRVLYHARGAFDLWGARYFIIPAHPGNWTRRNAATPRSSMRPT